MAPRVCSLQRNTTISAGGTEEEEVTQQENMAGMARMVRKIKKKKQKAKWTRKTVSWWVSELSAADRKRAWLHPEWADTMQEWYKWLHEERRRTRKKRREKQRKKLVPRMTSGGERGAGFLHKLTQNELRGEGFAGAGRVGGTCEIDEEM